LIDKMVNENRAIGFWHHSQEEGIYDMSEN